MNEKIDRDQNSHGEHVFMNQNKKKLSPRSAFIPIGIALMVVGMTTNTGLIGAGALFLIIGISSVKREKETQHSKGDSEE